jgi:Fe-S oxidoreductase
MNPERLRGTLNWDACVECGHCLLECRYLELSEAQAVEEIRNLNRGLTPNGSLVDRCASCLACNAFCPNDAHPYERIHFLWHYRLRRDGIPKRASYMMPTADTNFRTALRFSSDERALHRRWDTPHPPARTVLYPGCNILALPTLATGRLFEGLPVWGRWDLCCGEMYYRMGMLDTVDRMARELTAAYADQGLEELVFACPACFNMFRSILPDQFGARFDFRVTFFDEWLQRRLDRGDLTLTPRSRGSVVVHDSCHGRVLGGAFMDRQRELLRLAGKTVVETRQHREHGLCCGMAAGANRFSVVDLSRAALRQLVALNEAPADEVAIYCSGCLLTLSCARLASPLRRPLRHTLEYLHEAAGEPIVGRQRRRAAQLLAGIARHALPRYVSRKRLPMS